MTTPQIAVIGTGFIGPVHVEALRRLGVTVRGILGSSPEKSKQAADSLGIPLAYRDFAALLADDSLDAVHIASPNSLHREQALSCFHRGLHVVCEKPLALSTAEAEEMARAAANRPDLVSAVNYNVRFYPMALQARAMIADGELGELIHVQGSYLQDWLLYDTDFNWRVLSEHSGKLRAIGDIGSHWLDLLQFISGQKIESVIADLGTLHANRHRPPANARQTFAKGAPEQKGEAVAIDTEDYGGLMLRFERGTRGSLFVSQVAVGRKNEVSFDIYGTKASLRWNSERPEELLVGHRDQPNQLVQRNPALLNEAVSPFSNYPAGHAEGFPDTFKQLYRAVYQDVVAGKPAQQPLYATFQDGLHEMRLLDAIAASQQSRAWQTV